MTTHDNDIIDFNMSTHIKSWYTMFDLPYIKVWHDYTIIHIHIIVYYLTMIWYHVMISHFESIMWHDCGKSFINRFRDEEDIKNLPGIRWSFQNSKSLPGIYLKPPEFRADSKNPPRIPDKEPKDFSISQSSFQETETSFTETETPG